MRPRNGSKHAGFETWHGESKGGELGSPEFELGDFALLWPLILPLLGNGLILRLSEQGKLQACAQHTPTMTALYLWIALGGALGSVARFALAGWIARGGGGGFPWGTVVVNVLGCFVIGFFAAATGPTGRWPVGAVGRQFFMTGVLGGFTTFSSFSLQTLELAREGAWGRVVGNVAGSLGFCLLAVWLGSTAAAALNSEKGT